MKSTLYNTRAMDLFPESETDRTYAPLADRMRPRSWDEYVGQTHIVGETMLLRQAIEQNALPSMVFWGPPGSGKTSLARLIATVTDSHFVQFSAVTAGVKQIKEIVEVARRLQKLEGKRTLLFIDEVHRFNKAQQDAFLPHIEDGTIIFIGATTENPSFEINSALLSRSRVFVLELLSTEQLKKIVESAIKDKERGLGKLKVTLAKGVMEHLTNQAQGDARVALNALEFAVEAKRVRGKKISIGIDDISQALQKSPLLYDRAGEEHYNTISAYIKSMRASDVDAALYYLARMVSAGEDPLFIARRMVIFASEDIGMAQPTALVVANEVFRACETIGYPEAQINLAHGTVYMATAKKDRGAYSAYFAALDDVKRKGSLPIPMQVRNAPTKLMKSLGYGKGYEKYPKTGSYLPEKLKGKKYYVRNN